MIFSWLGKKDGKADNDPSREYLESLIGSPAAVLQLVFDWVEERSDAGKLNLAGMQLAETRLVPVLEEVEKGIAAQRRLGTGQQLLRAYCERFGRAYGAIAHALPAGHTDGLTVLLRAAHLLSRACRLARAAQEDPADLRRELLGLFDKAQQQGIALARKPAFSGRPETSVGQETALALLWETAPFDSLSLEQFEYMERFMAFYGKNIVLRTTAGATVSYAVLANGQVKPIEQAEEGGVPLFVGPGPLAGQMAGIIKLPDGDPLPVWAGTPLPDTDLRTLKSLAQHLTAGWERKRVQRGSDRQARQDNVRVTGGFDNIRRAVAYSAYVRAGGQLDAYGTRNRFISEHMREVMVGLETEEKQLTPTETIAAMEAVGDSKAIESWPACDSSKRGYNLAVPGYRAWLAVGGLLAIRENDDIDWQIAIVRRLYKANHSRRAGVEIFNGRPIPVGMGNAGQSTHASLADLRDAILITGTAGNWLVTTFDCETGSDYLVSGSLGRRMFRISERYWANADFKVYTCILAPDSTLNGA